MNYNELQRSCTPTVNGAADEDPRRRPAGSRHDVVPLVQAEEFQARDADTRLVRVGHRLPDVFAVPFVRDLHVRAQPRFMIGGDLRHDAREQFFGHRQGSPMNEEAHRVVENIHEDDGDIRVTLPELAPVSTRLLDVEACATMNSSGDPGGKSEKKAHHMIFSRGTAHQRSSGNR